MTTHRRYGVPRARTLPAAGFLLGTAALLLSGCTSPASTAQASMAALPEKTPEALNAYYSQELSWKDCGAKGFSCAKLRVPLDYDRPSAGDVKLTVSRKKAIGKGDRQGSLLVNPGGPGGSAVGYLQGYAALGYPAKVREAYDMVAVDPRGVGRSEPVTCLDGKQMDAFTRADVTPGDAAEEQALLASYKKFGQGCEKRSGDLLGHMSTVEAARDMDVLREVLGDKKLNYVGASYGTFLGATYAGLFPDKVGRMVLDGAMDPSLSARQMNQDQAAGFQSAFRAFATDCTRRSDCPLGPKGTTVAKAGQRLSDFFAALDRKPLATARKGRVLTEAQATTGVIAAMYDEAGWPRLRSALAQALGTDVATAGPKGNKPEARKEAKTAQEQKQKQRQEQEQKPGGKPETPEETPAKKPEGKPADKAGKKPGKPAAPAKPSGTALLTLSDSYYDRDANGTYANLMYANAAVNCLDLPPSFRSAAEVRSALPAFREASPVFGESLAWSALNCASWPVEPTGNSHRIEAGGADPILVVGTTRDPATPYRWARSLAAQLQSGVLLTYEGDGHTAYGRGSGCIDSAVDRYLLTGKPPQEGKSCS